MRTLSLQTLLVLIVLIIPSVLHLQSCQTQKEPNEKVLVVVDGSASWDKSKAPSVEEQTQYIFAAAGIPLDGSFSNKGLELTIIVCGGDVRPIEKVFTLPPCGSRWTTNAVVRGEQIDSFYSDVFSALSAAWGAPQQHSSHVYEALCYGLNVIQSSKFSNTAQCLVLGDGIQESININFMTYRDSVSLLDSKFDSISTILNATCELPNLDNVSILFIHSPLTSNADLIFACERFWKRKFQGAQVNFRSNLPANPVSSKVASF